ncbi:hypothetical protein HID58_042124 [Brassica napus]|uniref:Uncharacterized protein n=2 Tax=Brassica napus TaxID=3708 RepID=A0ABQ8BCS7_BRANA|nr:hypothetical protein HID58_042124 [Brassica napus]CDY35621.1 BnaC01g21430D [Brassica napus]
MYIKNFSAFSAKVDYGRSKQALHYNQRPCQPDFYMFRKSNNEEKEGLTGYWYFPKPDLPEIILAQEYFDSSRASYPEIMFQSLAKDGTIQVMKKSYFVQESICYANQINT